MANWSYFVNAVFWIVQVLRGAVAPITLSPRSASGQWTKNN